MTHHIAHPKNVHQKGDRHTVFFHGTDGLQREIFYVTSASSGAEYRVIVYGKETRCNCEWGHYRPTRDMRSACSHVQAVHEYKAQQTSRTTSAWGSPSEASKQHRPQIDLGDGVILTSRKAG